MIDAVIDISHHNGPHLDFAKARAAGIVGVIHKATQGIGGVDPMYVANRDKAKAAGLLWGAYHFGTGDDPLRQAAHLVDVAGKDGLLALDLEENPQGPTMTLAQARRFVIAVKDATGRYPLLYGSGLLKSAIGKTYDPLLSKCPLWLAQYGPAAVVPPTWPTWTLWQHTDGAVGPGPYAVDGIGHCDRSRFNGDQAGLRQMWGAA